VVVIASAGNTDQVSAVQFPARYDGVIAVGATNSSGSHSSISVAGPEVTICAPGEKILHAGRNSSLVLGTGTSDSAAIVSGVVALILEANPGLSPSDVAQRLTATADDIGAPGRDPIYGFGIVNPLAALTERLPLSIPPTGLNSSWAEGSPKDGQLSPMLVVTVGVILVFLLMGGLATLGLVRRSRHGDPV
jgi:subtilisin family serine protease